MGKKKLFGPCLSISLSFFSSVKLHFRSITWVPFHQPPSYLTDCCYWTEIEPIVFWVSRSKVTVAPFFEMVSASCRPQPSNFVRWLPLLCFWINRSKVKIFVTQNVKLFNKESSVSSTAFKLHSMIAYFKQKKPYCFEIIGSKIEVTVTVSA